MNLASDTPVAQTSVRAVDDNARRFSVAPMMDCTDRHGRYLMRLLTRHALLYTEMITASAILRGDRTRLLEYSPREHPLALQLGGNDPGLMAQCAAIGADWGYDEINMNVGCPSPRVSSGSFGACLMAEPERVGDCVASMGARTALPVTVKTRIGIDNMDRFEDLCRFVETVAKAGCRICIVHARKAWLTGLSPRDNRTVPPLRYDVVYALKKTFPELAIILNGGVDSIDASLAGLQRVDGVMVGRAAYNNPFMLAEVDQRIFGDPHTSTRESVLEEYVAYCEQQGRAGHHFPAMARHMMGLFQGEPNARAWRRHLSSAMHGSGAGSEAIRAAAQHVLAAA
jgi:tRNA-dihydrouridine synthase A